MKEDEALIKELKEEKKALVSALKEQKKIAKDAEARAARTEEEFGKRSGKLAAREREIDSLESEIKTRYALELKELKLFSDRIGRLAESGESVLKKREIIDLFKGFLTKIDSESAKKKAIKVSETLKSDEDETFELDDILTPKGDLDLKKLCEELGVYNGE